MDEQLLGSTLEWLLKGGQQSLGHRNRRFGIGRVLNQDGEFVPTHARDRIAGTHGANKPLAHRDEELVAFAVAEAVVDGLEIVEVEE